MRDLAIQERENDLVLATFGRGFYVLDNYAPLRAVTAGRVPEGRAHLCQPAGDRSRFPTSATIEVRKANRLWMGENPPFGAVITYWIKTTPQTARQRRQEAARAAEQKKATPAYPTQAELTAEADEEAPQTFLSVTDSAGKVVRRLTVPGGRGIHRFAWNLRGVGHAAAPGCRPGWRGRRWFWRQRRTGLRSSLPARTAWRYHVEAGGHDAAGRARRTSPSWPIQP